jgi:hypothetical protein
LVGDWERALDLVAVQEMALDLDSVMEPDSVLVMALDSGLVPDLGQV